MRRTDMIYSQLRIGVIALLMCALAVLPARAASTTAQNDALTEMQQKLDQSLQAIKTLEERVKQLEGKVAEGAAAPVAANPPAAEPARLEVDEQKLEQLERANASRNTDDTGLPLHGFADVGAGTHNPINKDLEGFYVGNLDFYLVPHLGDRTRALFEMNTEVGSDGTVTVDLERAQIGYQFSDLATVWLGRFHTPYGYVNTALHHGAWVNNSLRRPKFLQFEDNGGILPAHTVGLWTTGSVHSGAGRILYDAYVGNAQHITNGVLDQGNAGFGDNEWIGGGRIGYQLNEGALDGLTFGAHAFTARVTADATANQLASIINVLVYGGYAVYDTDQWENIAEFYLFDDDDRTFGTGTHTSNAEFVQLGYRTPWGMPYARYERTEFDQNDPYFYAQTSGGSYDRAALGVRFDIDLKSAIKFEFAETRQTDRAREQFGEGLVQYAIRF